MTSARMCQSNCIPVKLRLVAAWIGDVPIKSCTGGAAVSIEVALILTMAGLQHGLKTHSASASVLLTLFTNALLLFVSGVGLVLLAVERYFSTIEHAQEFGILKALGAPPSYFRLLLFLEALAICIPGAVAGIGLTLLIKLAVKLSFPKVLRLDIVPIWWAIALGVVLLISVLGAGAGARKAIRDGIVQALSDES